MEVPRTLDALHLVVGRLSDGQRHALMAVDHTVRGHAFCALVSASSAHSADPASWTDLYEEIVRPTPDKGLVIECYAHGVGESARALAAAARAADAIWFLRQGDSRTAAECAELAVCASRIWAPFLTAIRQDVATA